MRAGLDKPVNGVQSTNVVSTPNSATIIDTPSAAETIKTGTKAFSITNGVAKAEEEKDDDVPAIDFSLEEGRKILQDLISLTSKNGVKAEPVTARK
jgi:hypothetical protein